MLEHIPHQRLAISNLHSALKEDGVLFVHMPLARQKPVIFNKYLTDFHDWTEEEHTAEHHSRESILELLEECGFRIMDAENSFNHYLGEFAVSIIMLFYRDTVFNRLILALLTPLTWLLIHLDIALKNKMGNAIAILAKPTQE